MAVTRTVVIRILGKDQLSGILNPIGGRFSTLGKRIGKSIALGMGVATVAVAALGIAAVKAAASYEDAFTGVLKTTKGLADEFGNLNAEGLALRQQFKDLAATRPISFEDISLIGELGGQLGIAKDDLLDFTKVVSDLGATTNLTFESAAIGLARFTNVMGTAPEDFRKIGDVIVDLGNNFATTEEELLNFARRMAGAGAVAGLAEQEVLAIGTAFSSVGVESELGGTAVQKVLLKMVSAANSFGKGTVDNTKQIDKLNKKLIKANADLVKMESVTGETGQSMLDLRDSFGEGTEAAEAFGRTLGDTNRRKLFQAADSVQVLREQIELLREEQGKPSDPKILTAFAEASGRTVEAFVQDFESKPGEVFRDFIVGLGKQGKKGEDTLKSLELGDQRLIRSFLSLAAASGIAVEALALANNQIDVGGALAQEAILRYGTLQSRFQIFKNVVKNLGDTIGMIFVPSLKAAITNIVPLIRLVGPILENILTGSVSSLRRMITVMEDMGFSQDQIISVLSFARVVRKMAVDIGGRLVNAWQSAVRIGGQFISIIRNLFGAFQAGGISGLMDMLGLDPAIQTLVSNIVNDLVSGFQAVAGVISGSAGPALSFITDTIMPAMIRGIRFINENWELFRNIILGIGAAFAGIAIVGVLSTIGSAIAGISFVTIALGTAIGILVTAWTQNWGGIQDAVTGAWNKISPIFSDIVDWLKTDLPAAFQAGSISDALKALFGSEKFAELISTLKTDVPIILGDLVEAIATFFSEKASLVQDAILELFGVETFSELVSTTITGLPNVLGSLITAITDFFAEQKATVSKAFLDLFIGDEMPPPSGNMVEPILGPLITSITDFFAEQKPIVSKAFLDLFGLEDPAIPPMPPPSGDMMPSASIFSQLFGVESLQQVFGEILVAIPELLQSVVDAIAEFITNNIPTIQEELQGWTDAFISWVGKVAEGLGGALFAITIAIAAWATSSDTQTSLAETGEGIGESIVTGIGNLFDNAERIAVIMGKLASALLAGVGIILGTLAIVGGQIVAGIVAGMIEKLTGGEVEVALFSELGGILSSIATNIGTVAATVGGAIISGMVSGIGEGTATLISASSNLATVFVNAFLAELDIRAADIGTIVKTIGGAVILGFLSGIGEGTATLIEEINNLARIIVNAIKSELGISSPSTVFFSIGADLVQGLIDGILSKTQGVTDAISGMLGGLFGGEEPGGGMGNLLGGLFGGLFGGEEDMSGEMGLSFDFAGLLESLLVTIPQALTTFQELFSLTFTTLTELLSTTLPSWAELFSATFLTMGTILSDFWGTVLTNWTTSLEALSTDWEENWIAIRDILVNISPIIIRVGTDTAKGVAKAFSDIDWRGLGKSIGKGIEDGLRSKKNAIVDLAKEIAKAALIAAKKELGVSSPSREFFKLGANMMQGLGQGVKGSQGGPLEAVRKVANNLISAGSVSNGLMPNGVVGGGSSGGGSPTITQIFNITLNGVNDPRVMFEGIEREAKTRGKQFAMVS